MKNKSNLSRHTYSHLRQRTRSHKPQACETHEDLIHRVHLLEANVGADALEDGPSKLGVQPRDEPAHHDRNDPDDARDDDRVRSHAVLDRRRVGIRFVDCRVELLGVRVSLRSFLVEERGKEKDYLAWEDGGVDQHRDLEG